MNIMIIILVVLVVIETILSLYLRNEAKSFRDRLEKEEVNDYMCDELDQAIERFEGKY